MVNGFPRSARYLCRFLYAGPLRPLSQKRRTFSRGRDEHCWSPPAQIRTSGITAYGSYLGCIASKRTFGCGSRILASTWNPSTDQRKEPLPEHPGALACDRRSARYEYQITWARKLFRLSMLRGTAWLLDTAGLACEDCVGRLQALDEIEIAATRLALRN